MAKKGYVLMALIAAVSFTALQNVSAAESVYTTNDGKLSEAKTNAAASTAAAAKETVNEGTISVNSNILDASVYIDGSYIGKIPVTKSGIKPGNHVVRVSASHYEKKEITINLRSNETQSLYFELEKITGEIYITTDLPASVTPLIYCDGSKISKNPVEADEGNRKVEVKAFGYDTYTTTLYVQRKSFQHLQVQMKEVEFRLLGLIGSKKTFNPQNRGHLGQIEFTSSVNAPGTGTLVITNMTGQTVATRQVTFTTWENSIVWDGTADGGYKVEDGDYTATLHAGNDSKSVSFRVDSTISYPQLTVTPDGTGVGTVPSARMTPAGTLVFDLGAGLEWKKDSARGSSAFEFSGIPLEAGLSWAISDVMEFSGLVKVTLSEQPSVGGNIALKLGSSNPIANGTLHYALILRAGIASEPKFAPFGADYGSGLSAGIAAGYSTGNLYVGGSAQYIYKPVTGPFADGSDSSVKGTGLVQYTMESGSLSAYGAVNSPTGSYDYTVENENGTSVRHTGDLEGIRSYEAGLQFASYLGDSGSSFVLNGGAVFFEDGPVYPYAGIKISFML